MKRNTWAVIPAYNEGKNILDVLRKARKFVSSVVVVDDGSDDDTVAKASKANAKVIRHIINLGKGSALKTGCDFAVSKGADNIVVMDADGQHDPAQIPKFVGNLKSADVVFGFRRLNKMPAIFKFGNWFINLTTRILYGIKLKDTQCGFRAFTRKAYRKIRWNATDYSMESEMIANIGKHHLKYTQIPIPTIYADRYKGTTILDGAKIVLNMILWRLRK